MAVLELHNGSATGPVGYPGKGCAVGNVAIRGHERKTPLTLVGGFPLPLSARMSVQKIQSVQ